MCTCDLCGYTYLALDSISQSVESSPAVCAPSAPSAPSASLSIPASRDVVIQAYRLETVNAMHQTINHLQKILHTPNVDPLLQTQSVWMMVQRFLKIYADMMRSVQVKVYIEKKLQTLIDLSPEEFYDQARILAEEVHQQMPCASASLLEDKSL